MLQQVIQRVNENSGVPGPTLMPSGVDVQGKTVTGLAAPTSASDAISAGHADSQYSASALAPQLDLGGKNALKGLTYLFLQKYVNQLIAGSGVTISPNSGQGTVTISATGSGGTITSVVAGPGLSGGGSSGSVTLSLSTPITVANGGTGTATPSLIAGSNVTVTGSWPNQTITASGAVSQIIAGTNVTISPSGGTGAVTINASGGGGGFSLGENWFYNV
jgi:hypothetical protein